MDSQTLEKICTQVYRRFPEVKGSKPSVQAHATAQSLLIFKGKGMTAGGAAIQHTVRVVVDDRGKIIKMTSSR